MLTSCLLSVAGTSAVLGKKPLQINPKAGRYHEYIASRGVSSIRVAESETELDLAYEAAQKALEDAKLKAEEVGLIIYCSCQKSGYRNSSSALISRLKATSAFGFDIEAGLLGGIIGLQLANDLMKGSGIKTALIVSAQKHEHIEGEKLAFSDSAAAAALSAYPNSFKLLACSIRQDNYSKLTDSLEGRKSILDMFSEDSLASMIEKGSDNLARTLDLSMKSINLDMGDLNYIAKETFGSAEREQISKKSKLAADKVYDKVTEYGHLGSVAPLFNLHLLRKSDLLRNLDLMALSVTGYDCSAGSVIIRK